MPALTDENIDLSKKKYLKQVIQPEIFNSLIVTPDNNHNLVFSQRKVNVCFKNNILFLYIQSNRVTPERLNTPIRYIVFEENCFRAILIGFHPFLISDCVPRHYNGKIVEHHNDTVMVHMGEKL